VVASFKIGFAPGFTRTTDENTSEFAEPASVNAARRAQSKPDYIGSSVTQRIGKSPRVQERIGHTFLPGRKPTDISIRDCFHLDRAKLATVGSDYPAIVFRRESSIVQDHSSFGDQIYVYKERQFNNAAPIRNTGQYLRKNTEAIRASTPAYTYYGSSLFA
jgi:hypothetical protein